MVDKPRDDAGWFFFFSLSLPVFSFASWTRTSPCPCAEAVQAVGNPAFMTTQRQERGKKRPHRPRRGRGERRRGPRLVSAEVNIFFCCFSPLGSIFLATADCEPSRHVREQDALQGRDSPSRSLRTRRSVVSATRKCTNRQTRHRPDRSPSPLFTKCLAAHGSLQYESSRMRTRNLFAVFDPSRVVDFPRLPYRVPTKRIPASWILAVWLGEVLDHSLRIRFS